MPSSETVPIFLPILLPLLFQLFCAGLHTWIHIRFSFWSGQFCCFAGRMDGHHADAVTVLRNPLATQALATGKLNLLLSNFRHTHPFSSGAGVQDSNVSDVGYVH